MKIDRVLELLKIERECVTRQSPCNEKSKLCDRNCGECDIAQNDLELIEMYDFVISMIETLIGRSKWISVKDKLPDDASDVLAYYDDGTESRIIPVNYYKQCWYDCVFNRAIDGLETGFIKYWMSLPKAPEVKQNETD